MRKMYKPLQFEENQSIYVDENYEHTPVSKQIRILSEVEKIWIIYDVDQNGTLDYDEIKMYLKEMAYPHLKLNENQLISIFKSIDKDNSGFIDKHEMA